MYPENTDISGTPLHPTKTCTKPFYGSRQRCADLLCRPLSVPCFPLHPKKLLADFPFSEILKVFQHLACAWRTAFQTAAKMTRAVADSDQRRIFHFFIALADADALGKRIKSAIFVQSLQCVDQVAETGRAGIFGKGVAGEVPGIAGRMDADDALRFIELDDVGMGEIGAASSVFLGKSDILDVLEIEAHQTCTEGVTEDAVTGCEHAVGLDWIASLLEIHIPVQRIDHDEIGMAIGVERGNRLHQAESVEAPFGFVGKDALHVLEGAGHQCLAVAFQHRKGNQKVTVHDGLADLHGDAFADNRLILVFLAIDDVDVVLATDIIIPVGAESPVGVIPDPGSFLYDDVGESLFLEVLDDGDGNFRVGRGSSLGGDTHDKVRLQHDLRVGVSDKLVQLGSLDELMGHRARIGTVGDDDIFWFLHVPMIKRIRSRCNSILTGSRSLFPARVSENGRAPGRTALPTG